MGAGASRGSTPVAGGAPLGEQIEALSRRKMPVGERLLGGLLGRVGKRPEHANEAARSWGTSLEEAELDAGRGRTEPGASGPSGSAVVGSSGSSSTSTTRNSGTWGVRVRKSSAGVTTTTTAATTGDAGADAALATRSPLTAVDEDAEQAVGRQAWRERWAEAGQSEQPGAEWSEQLPGRVPSAAVGEDGHTEAGRSSAFISDFGASWAGTSIMGDMSCTLREAVRLVIDIAVLFHHTQSERGTSVCFVAGFNRGLRAELKKARKAVDAAFAKLKQASTDRLLRAAPQPGQRGRLTLPHLDLRFATEHGRREAGSFDDGVRHGAAQAAGAGGHQGGGQDAGVPPLPIPGTMAGTVTPPAACSAAGAPLPAP